jgi:hypothetical protein
MHDEPAFSIDHQWQHAAIPLAVSIPISVEAARGWLRWTDRRGWSVCTSVSSVAIEPDAAVTPADREGSVGTEGQGRGAGLEAAELEPRRRVR